MTELREYQVRGVDHLRRRMNEGVMRQLLVSPTGSGKGTLLAWMVSQAVARGMRVLFIVAGKQLVEEFSHRLTRQYHVAHGIVMAGTPSRLSLPVQIASIDTLRSWLKRPDKHSLPEAELIILDEADQAKAERYLVVLPHYPNAYIIGTTATPVRADGAGLGGGLFEEMFVAAKPRELIDAGYLVDYDGRVFDSIDDTATQDTGGTEFNGSRVYEKLGVRGREKLLGDIVEQWHALALGRRTIGFAMNIEHSKSIVERFRNERHHGAPVAVVEHIDADSPLTDRMALMDRVYAGETQIVVNVGILGRGVDLPCLEVCAFWRPTKSLALYLQQAGRVFRLSPETGKAAAFFLDHAGNVRRHGLPDKDRDWSLDDGEVVKSDEPAEPAVRTCWKCRVNYFVRRGRGCTACGELPKVKAQQLPIEEVLAVTSLNIRDATPLELDRKEADRLAFWVGRALAQGYKLRWAGHMFAGKDQSKMPANDVLEKVAASVRRAWAKKKLAKELMG